MDCSRQYAGRGAQRHEMPAQVHPDHVVPLAVRHVDDRAVPQDAGIVHEHVQRAELLDRLLDQPGGALGGRNVVPVGDRLAARRPYFLDHLLGWRGVSARAVGSAAQVVDDDLGAFGSEQQRVLAAKAAAGAGDDGDSVVKRAHSRSLRRCLDRSVPTNQARYRADDPVV